MKVCCTNLSYLNLNLRDFFLEIKKIGYQNIELAPFLYNKKFKESEIRKIKEEADKKKIIFESLQSIFSNMNTNNCDISINIDKMYERINEIIKTAQILNVKKISYGSSPVRKLNRNNKNNILNILVIKKLTQIAKKINATIMIEPIANKYGNKFLVNIDEIIDVIKKLQIANLKMLVDTGNLMSSKINFKDFFKTYRKDILHIHISNKNIYYYDQKTIFKYLKFLQKEKYAGSVTIEYISNYGMNLEDQYEILNWMKN